MLIATYFNQRQNSEENTNILSENRGFVEYNMYYTHWQKVQEP